MKTQDLLDEVEKAVRACIRSLPALDGERLKEHLERTESDVDFFMAAGAKLDEVFNIDGMSETDRDRFAFDRDVAIADTMEKLGSKRIGA